MLCAESDIVPFKCLVENIQRNSEEALKEIQDLNREFVQLVDQHYLEICKIWYRDDDVIRYEEFLNEALKNRAIT